MEFLRLLAQYRTPWLVSLFSSITLLGTEVFSITVISFFYWCYDKTLARKICVSYFASGLIVQALKISFCIPRPWIIDRTFQPVEGMLNSATGYSFPSGHTQSSSSLFGSLFFFSKKTWQRIIFALFILGVAFSRMYLGYHTPKDVITSMCISFFMVYLFNKIIDVSNYDNQKVAIFLAVFSFCLLVYAFIKKSLPSSDLTQFHDFFKAAGAGLGFALGWYIEPLYIQFNEKSGSLSFQVTKLFLGLFIAVLLKSGLKIILGSSFTADTIRYFILICWIMILYPMLMVKLFQHKNLSQENK